MRLKEREITDNAEIEKIIKGASICRIGLVDNDEPYIVPVCFGYEKNALYFHGALAGRKVKLIRKNNRVCFEMETGVAIVGGDEPCGWTAKYRSVIGVGRACILQGDEEKAHGLKVIMRQYSEKDFNFPKERLDSVLVVRIDVESITGKKSGY